MRSVEREDRQTPYLVLALGLKFHNIVFDPRNRPAQMIGYGPGGEYRYIKMLYQGFKPTNMVGVFMSNEDTVELVGGESE